MQLTLQPNVQLVVNIIENDVDEADAQIQHYEVVGPTREVEMIAKLFPGVGDDSVRTVRGPLSPVAPITLPKSVWEAAGIPAKAKYFAFAYPACIGFYKKGEVLNTDNLQPMDKQLLKLNLVEEMWGFFLLVGGFIYMDENKQILQNNALTLVPTDFMMNFNGPKTPGVECLQGLQTHGRMINVTLETLQEAGFKAFGWAHANEKPDGHALSTSEGYKHGAFVYIMKGAPPTFFALEPHDDEQLAEFEESQGRRPARKGNLHGKIGLNRQMTQMKTAKTLVQKEEREMSEITGESTLSRSKAFWRFVNTWTRIALVWFGGPPVVLILGSIAYGNSLAFELLASLVWNSAFLFVSWVPFRDTAAAVIMRSSPKRAMLFSTLQYATPLFLAALSSLGASEGSMSREDSNSLVVVVGKFMIYLGMPLLLFYLRTKVADDLEKQAQKTIAMDRPLADASGGIQSRTSTTTMTRVIEIQPTKAVDASSASTIFDAIPSASGAKDKRTISELSDYLVRHLAVDLSCLPQVLGELDADGDGLINRDEFIRCIRTGDIELNNPIKSPRPAPPKPRAAPPKPPVAPLPPGRSSPDEPTPKKLQLQRRFKDGANWNLAMANAIEGQRKDAKLDATAAPAAAKHLVGFMVKTANRRSARVAPKPKSSSGAKAKPPIEVRAATKLQARARGRQARQIFLKKLRDRQARMRYLAKPILIASIVDIVANLVVLEFLDRGGPDWFILLSFISTMAAIGVCLKDVRKPASTRPRFSLTHGIFLVSVLYHAAFKASRLDSFIWKRLEDGGMPSDLVPTVTMVIHLCLFILVTSVGKMSLNVVATTNACPHLLFPFQFFDFVFLYSFFSLRGVETFVTPGWIIQQVILQISVVLRNSGTTEALTAKLTKGHNSYLAQCVRCLSGKVVNESLKGIDYSNDPLLRLQYLARVGWQFDLADLAALIATPTIVSFFVWRDSYYTLQGTSIYVRPCDVTNLWSRFAVLLLIKPAASTFARNLLRTKMRKTLLGKETMHGKSQLAAKIMAERKIKRGADGDEQVRKAFASVYVDEELAAVEEELSLSGLNFAVTRMRAMKKWNFYLTVIILTLFSAFQVRIEGPANPYEEGVAYTFSDCNENNGFSSLPLSSVWLYVPPSIIASVDCDLIEAIKFNVCQDEWANNTQADVCLETQLVAGWPEPEIDILFDETAFNYTSWNRSDCEEILGYEEETSHNTTGVI